MLLTKMSRGRFQWNGMSNASGLRVRVNPFGNIFGNRCVIRSA